MDAESIERSQDGSRNDATEGGGYGGNMQYILRKNRGWRAYGRLLYMGYIGRYLRHPPAEVTGNGLGKKKHQSLTLAEYKYHENKTGRPVLPPGKGKKD